MKNLIPLKALIFLNAFLIMAQHNPANEYMHKISPEELAKSFDNPERDEWQKPEVVIQKYELFF